MYIHTYIQIIPYVYTYIYTNYSIRKIDLHTYTHTCMHTSACYIRVFRAIAFLLCIHTYVTTCTHTYARTCIHAYIHACIHAYIHTSACAYILLFRVSAFLLCVHTYVTTCTHTYAHTYAHICMHTYISLGVLIYECFARVRPFNGIKSSMALLQQVVVYGMYVCMYVCV